MKMRRAFTKDQKKQIILRIYRLWMNNPELRLAQLFENVFHHLNDDHCFYHLEDEDLANILERFYNHSN